MHQPTTDDHLTGDGGTGGGLAPYVPQRKVAAGSKT